MSKKSLYDCPVKYYHTCTPVYIPYIYCHYAWESTCKVGKIKTGFGHVLKIDLINLIDLTAFLIRIFPYDIFCKHFVLFLMGTETGFAPFSFKISFHLQNDSLTCLNFAIHFLLCPWSHDGFISSGSPHCKQVHKNQSRYVASSF